MFPKAKISEQLAICTTKTRIMVQIYLFHFNCFHLFYFTIFIMSMFRIYLVIVDQVLTICLATAKRATQISFCRLMLLWEVLKMCSLLSWILGNYVFEKLRRPQNNTIPKYGSLWVSCWDYHSCGFTYNKLFGIHFIFPPGFMLPDKHNWISISKDR